jgi:hypothetical protein
MALTVATQICGNVVVFRCLVVSYSEMRVQCSAKESEVRSRGLRRL